MVGIHGIGEIPEPANSKKAPERSATRDIAASNAARDGVELSTESVTASKAARVRAVEIREERVAKAKESIEQGAYRIQEVVLQVADRIARYVD